jgi:hypothetical protein
MESCPRKEVENFEEKLVEENFYLITEVLLAITFEQFKRLSTSNLVVYRRVSYYIFLPTVR